MSAPEYEIININDFLKVPEDRVDACLKEFRTFIALMRAHGDLTKSLGEFIGVDAGIECKRFVWVDDDLGNVEINMIAEPELSASPPVMKEEGR